MAIFLIALFAICIFLGVLHYKGGKSSEWYEIEEILYVLTGYNSCHPYPSDKDWTVCCGLKGKWKYFEKEKVQKIVFWRELGYEGDLLEGQGLEITDPEKIKQTLHLIETAKKANNGSIVWLGRMGIVTEKHKFIIPAEGGEKAIYGLDWTSKELRKKLWEWGWDRKVYKYDLPSKGQVVAILLYPLKKSPPLALFGDRKLAEKLVFEPNVRDDPNGIIGLSSLYKTGRMLKFGFEFKKEEGKWITISNELEPKKIFEGRDWLEKIMDAYEAALKEAEEREKYFPMEMDNYVGRIIFMTQEKDYWKKISFDANTVFDDYIKSEQIKTYFDELGLTKELLAGNQQIKEHLAESNDSNTADLEERK
jgi:hypothetical protein